MRGLHLAKIFNENTVSFKQKLSLIPEFAWHTSERLAEVANSKHLVFDIRSLDPDKYSFPYHFHRSAEEIFVILTGKAMLRTPEGFTEVSEGMCYFLKWGPKVLINFIIIRKYHAGILISERIRV